MNRANAEKVPRRPKAATISELPNKLITIKDLASHLGRNANTVLAVLVFKGEKAVKLGKYRVVEPAVARRMVDHLREYDKLAAQACG